MSVKIALVKLLYSVAPIVVILKYYTLSWGYPAWWLGYDERADAYWASMSHPWSVFLVRLFRFFLPHYNCLSHFWDVLFCDIACAQDGLPRLQRWITFVLTPVTNVSVYFPAFLVIVIQAHILFSTYLSSDHFERAVICTINTLMISIAHIINVWLIVEELLPGFVSF